MSRDGNFSVYPKLYTTSVKCSANFGIHLDMSKRYIFFGLV